HSFESDTERVKTVPRHPTRVEPLLLAASRLLDARRVELALAPARGKYPRLRGYAEAIAERFQIGTAAVRVLRRMDGSRPTGELLAMYEGAGAHAIIVALLAADEVELLDVARPSSMPPPKSSAPDFVRPTVTAQPAKLPRIPPNAAKPRASPQR